jgi:hypothetical protein
MGWAVEGDVAELSSHSTCIINGQIVSYFKVLSLNLPERLKKCANTSISFVNNPGKTCIGAF